MARVVAIGECMVELAQDSDRAFRLGYAGDTFNTAIYLSRLGLTVDYATAVGDDPHSDGAIAMMVQEAIGTRLVSRRSARTLGLYLIQNDADGERQFSYWRDRAPIRDLFDGACPDWREAILSADAVYLSGITLAVVGETGRQQLSGWLAEARAKGSRVFFDANYRERLWLDAEQAAGAFAALIAIADIVSASAQDVAMLWPGEDIASLWAANGIEVVERRPSLEAVVHANGAMSVIVGDPVRAVDATGAGDSFNAAYLAARLSGAPPAAAAEAGHELAACVVATRGAILPRAAMPDRASLTRSQ